MRRTVTDTEERSAIVAMVRRFEEVHNDHAKNGKRYKAASRNHADACRLIADAIERGDHHAQAIEAGTAETAQTGSVHESAVSTGDAP